MHKPLSSTRFTFSDREFPVRMGKYHLMSRLMVDPIGEAFLAAWGVDDGIDQLRVVRCIYPRIAEEAEFIALFSEEARSLSHLSSGNIVRVMEVNIDDRIPYVAREHVEGLTLSRMSELARGQTALWPWELAGHVVSEILRGLDYVHRREDVHGNPMGMRHGDLRPENVLVSFDGEVKLFNFGSMLRFIVDEATHARLSRVREVFLPPEADIDDEPGVDGDLWAAGLILVFLLGGRLPSSRLSQWRPPMLHPRVEALPEVMDTYISRALNPDPEFRFRTAAAMRSELLQIMGEFAKGHPPDELSEWIRLLGKEDRDKEQSLVRSMLGRKPDMSLSETATGSSGTALGPGSVLDDRYHLLRQLGEGGMGTVFEAEHLGIGKRVAVKVLHERVMNDSGTVERFRREARIIGRIGHPNIVGAVDFGMSLDSHYYMVMEMLEGKSLSSLISANTLSYGDIVNIMVGVCDGLQAAHAAGVIHRDLKPDNILVTTEGPRILDFGIAKAIGIESENEGLTRTGHICGTVDYIAPEQIRGISNDPRSDIYAVGVILYELLTGVTPFHGRTVGEAMHKAIHDKLVPPSRRSDRKDIPSQLEAICLKALHRKADKRYASADALGDALRALSRKWNRADPRLGSSRPRLDRPMTSTSAALAAASIGPPAYQRWVVFGVTGLVVLGAGVLLFRTDLAGWRFSTASTAAPEAGANPSLPQVPPPSTHTAHGLLTIETVGSRDEGKAQDSDPGGLSEVEGPKSERSTIPDVPADRVVPPARQKSTSTSAGLSESLDRAQKASEAGQAHLRARRYTEAEGAFREAVRQNHRDSGAWFGLGKVDFARGRYEDAIEHVLLSIRYSSSVHLAERRNFLGVLYQSSGHTDRAVAQWRRVLSQNPSNAEARRHLRAAGITAE